MDILILVFLIRSRVQATGVWIKSCINHKSRFTIHSSLDLPDKIKNVSLPAQASLISFDVTDLFPSLPRMRPRCATLLLRKVAHVPQFIIDEIMTLLKLCLRFCGSDPLRFLALVKDSSIVYIVLLA